MKFFSGDGDSRQKEHSDINYRSRDGREMQGSLLSAAKSQFRADTHRA